ncbi:MAG: hypothetical protein COA67_10875 [Lutibacter sp.]|nr:MAG: hypothetical protein COA67_10875 [Lutibacter sp.]
MKTIKRIFLTLILAMTCITINGQVVTVKSQELQNFRPTGYDGINIFETKKDTVKFDGLKVKMGADFALQFQGLNHSNDLDNLVDLGSNVNLPTANLNIDAQLIDGVRVHLRTYLSSRHHNESWVKGGYLQIDNLDFIKEGFGSKFTDIASIRIGVDEINYGDAHFRRSDNASAIYNPFVGNYLMDSYSTEAFMELNLMPKSWIVVLGLSNGYLNPTVVKDETTDNKVTFYSKLGFEKQIDEDLRVRVTGSYYTAGGYSNGNHLYAGDRAGSRYYNIFREVGGSDNFRSGRVNPGFKNETAFQINPFVKYKGLEFFGILEQTKGLKTKDGFEKGKYTQIGAELIYRFGTSEQLYVGTRYNSVKGHGEYANGTTKPEEMKVDRFQLGAGWFMSKNILTKLEYVNQTYDENYGGSLTNANFKGVVFEAVISF